MLVLHRKIDESIVLITQDGQRITVTVASFQRGGVRLGIVADSGVTIVRSELEDKQPPIVNKLLKRQREISTT